MDTSFAEMTTERVVFETLFSDISAYVTTVASGRLEEAIESALDAVRRFF